MNGKIDREEIITSREYKVVILTRNFAGLTTYGYEIPELNIHPTFTSTNGD